MSDFDREAEREKLREKYERDKEKREASERMSELLLQGATMTNRHCPECHSPVFRYEGRQFCPTCEKEITEEDDTDADAGGTPGSEAADADPDDAGRSDADPDGATAESAGSAVGTPADDVPEDARPDRSADDRRTPSSETPADRRSDAGGEFRDAEASLRREIGSLTRRAEETRDVGRKRDLLAAAREAAETLGAIRRL